MEINRFYVEKAKVDGMRLEENKIEENPSEKGIKESIWSSWEKLNRKGNE